MVTKRITLAVLAIAAVGVAVLLVGRSRNDSISTDELSASEKQADGSAVGKSKVRRTTINASTAILNGTGIKEKDTSETGEALDAWVEELPRQYQRLGQAIVDASDRDDLAALKKLAPQAQNCPNADVRQRMVESLDWFGKDALVELTGLLCDHNGEVASSACTAWESALEQIEDESFKVDAVADAMKVVSNTETLSSIITIIEMADDRKASVLALAGVAESGNSAAMEAVREAYEFITGEEWVDAKTARRTALTIDVEDDDD